MNGHVETDFKPAGYAVDDGRPIRVLIIGAGLSGIALYIRLLQHVPAAQVTIIEKNPQAGGTWYENRYPGVACDIPSHVYQYSFEPNTQWSKLFASGQEILKYVQGVAHKYGVDKKIKYNTRATKAEWNEDTNTWTVDTESTKLDGTNDVGSVESEVVISAVGILNNWKWPDIEGLHDFQGKLLHSANWDTSWWVIIPLTNIWNYAYFLIGTMKARLLHSSAAALLQSKSFPTSRRNAHGSSTSFEVELG